MKTCFKFWLIVALFFSFAFPMMEPVRAAPPKISEEGYWDDRFDIPGMNGLVSALAMDGDTLYVAGYFTRIDDVAANNIAKWDGQQWSALGQGIAGEIHTIVADAGGIWVGGKFSIPGSDAEECIAHWDGQTWVAVGNPHCEGCQVHKLLHSGDELYAGGSFSILGGMNALNIARWDGTDWTALGNGVEQGVSDIAVNGSDVYAVTSGVLRKLDGPGWSGVDCNAAFPDYGNVTDIAFLDNNLYIGGWLVNGWEWGFLNRWDGENCTYLFDRLGSGVSDLHVMDKQLLIAFYDGISAYDGNAISFIGKVEGQPFTLAAIDDVLYAGGRFASIDGTFTPSVARRVNGTWSSLVSDTRMGLGINSGVSGLVVQSGVAYVAGVYSAGDTPMDGIVQWDGDEWIRTPGLPEHQGIGRLVSDRDSLYALTGEYEDDTWTVVIYKREGDSWTYETVVYGIVQPIGAIVVFKDRLYVANQSLHTIQVWDGSQWQSIGAHHNKLYDSGNVHAFGVVGDILYVGGEFTSIGGVPARNLAAWDGVQWSAPGDSEGPVHVLAGHKGSLYVGGKFLHIGGIEARNVARLDGTSWSALGTGVRGLVRALAFQQDTLIAGGNFIYAGDLTVNHVARWDGTQWTALGSGTNGNVGHLAVLKDQLLVGGDFTEAGGKPSYHFAIWHTAVPKSPVLVAPPDNATGTARKVKLDWRDVFGATTYRLQVREASRTGTRAVKESIAESHYRTLPLDNETKYVWRVRACLDLHCGAWSTWRAFTVK